MAYHTEGLMCFGCKHVGKEHPEYLLDENSKSTDSDLWASSWCYKNGWENHSSSVYCGFSDCPDYKVKDKHIIDLEEYPLNKYYQDKKFGIDNIISLKDYTEKFINENKTIKSERINIIKEQKYPILKKYEDEYNNYVVFFTGYNVGTVVHVDKTNNPKIRIGYTSKYFDMSVFENFIGKIILSSEE